VLRRGGRGHCRLLAGDAGGLLGLLRLNPLRAADDERLLGAGVGARSGARRGAATGGGARHLSGCGH